MSENVASVIFGAELSPNFDRNSEHVIQRLTEIENKFGDAVRVIGGKPIQFPKLQGAADFVGIMAKSVKEAIDSVSLLQKEVKSKLESVSSAGKPVKKLADDINKLGTVAKEANTGKLAEGLKKIVPAAKVASTSFRQLGEAASESLTGISKAGVVEKSSRLLDASSKNYAKNAEQIKGAAIGGIRQLGKFDAALQKQAKALADTDKTFKANKSGLTAYAGTVNKAVAPLKKLFNSLAQARQEAQKKAATDKEASGSLEKTAFRTEQFNDAIAETIAELPAQTQLVQKFGEILRSQYTGAFEKSTIVTDEFIIAIRTAANEGLLTSDQIGKLVGIMNQLPTVTNEARSELAKLVLPSTLSELDALTNELRQVDAKSEKLPAVLERVVSAFNNLGLAGEMGGSKFAAALQEDGVAAAKFGQIVDSALTAAKATGSKALGGLEQAIARVAKQFPELGESASVAAQAESSVASASGTVTSDVVALSAGTELLIKSTSTLAQNFSAILEQFNNIIPPLNAASEALVGIAGLFGTLGASATDAERPVVELTSIIKAANETKFSLNAESFAPLVEGISTVNVNLRELIEIVSQVGVSGGPIVQFANSAATGFQNIAQSVNTVNTAVDTVPDTLQPVATILEEVASKAPGVASAMASVGEAVGNLSNKDVVLAESFERVEVAFQEALQLLGRGTPFIRESTSENSVRGINEVIAAIDHLKSVGGDVRLTPQDANEVTSFLLSLTEDFAFTEQNLARFREQFAALTNLFREAGVPENEIVNITESFNASLRSLQGIDASTTLDALANRSKLAGSSIQSLAKDTNRLASAINKENSDLRLAKTNYEQVGSTLEKLDAIVGGAPKSYIALRKQIQAAINEFLALDTTVQDGLGPTFVEFQEKLDQIPQGGKGVTKTLQALAKEIADTSLNSGQATEELVQLERRLKKVGIATEGYTANEKALAAEFKALKASLGGASKDMVGVTRAGSELNTTLTAIGKSAVATAKFKSGFAGDALRAEFRATGKAGKKIVASTESVAKALVSIRRQYRGSTHDVAKFNRVLDAQTRVMRQSTDGTVQVAQVAEELDKALALDEAEIEKVRRSAISAARGTDKMANAFENLVKQVIAADAIKALKKRLKDLGSTTEALETKLEGLRNEKAKVDETLAKKGKVDKEPEKNFGELVGKIKSVESSLLTLKATGDEGALRGAVVNAEAFLTSLNALQERLTRLPLSLLSKINFAPNLKKAVPVLIESIGKFRAVVAEAKGEVTALNAGSPRGDLPVLRQRIAILEEENSIIRKGQEELKAIIADEDLLTGATKEQRDATISLAKAESQVTGEVVETIGVVRQMEAEFAKVLESVGQLATNVQPSVTSMDELRSRSKRLAGILRQAFREGIISAEELEVSLLALDATTQGTGSAFMAASKAKLQDATATNELATSADKAMQSLIENTKATRAERESAAKKRGVISSVSEATAKLTQEEKKAIAIEREKEAQNKKNAAVARERLASLQDGISITNETVAANNAVAASSVRVAEAKEAEAKAANDVNRSFAARAGNVVLDIGPITQAVEAIGELAQILKTIDFSSLGKIEPVVVNILKAIGELRDMLAQVTESMASAFSVASLEKIPEAFGAVKQEAKSLADAIVKAFNAEQVSAIVTATGELTEKLTPANAALADIAVNLGTIKTEIEPIAQSIKTSASAAGRFAKSLAAIKKTDFKKLLSSIGQVISELETIASSGTLLSEPIVAVVAAIKAVSEQLAASLGELSGANISKLVSGLEKSGEVVSTIASVDLSKSVASIDTLAIALENAAQHGVTLATALGLTREAILETARASLVEAEKAAEAQRQATQASEEAATAVGEKTAAEEAGSQETAKAAKQTAKFGIELRIAAKAFQKIGGAFESVIAAGGTFREAMAAAGTELGSTRGQVTKIIGEISVLSSQSEEMSKLGLTTKDLSVAFASLFERTDLGARDIDALGRTFAEMQSVLPELSSSLGGATSAIATLIVDAQAGSITNERLAETFQAIAAEAQSATQINKGLGDSESDLAARSKNNIEILQQMIARLEFLETAAESGAVSLDKLAASNLAIARTDAEKKLNRVVTGIKSEADVAAQATARIKQLATSLKDANKGSDIFDKEVRKAAVDLKQLSGVAGKLGFKSLGIDANIVAKQLAELGLSAKQGVGILEAFGVATGKADTMMRQFNGSLSISSAKMRTGVQGLINMFFAQARFIASGFVLFGILRTMGEGFKRVGEQEKALAKVQTVLNNSTADLATNQAALIEVMNRAATTLGVSLEESSQALFQLGSAGLSSRDAIAALEPVLNLTVGTLAETGETAKIVAGIYKNFFKESINSADATNKFRQIVDVMGRSFKTTLINVDGLRQGLKFIGGTAKNTNLSLSDSIAVLSQFNDKMIRNGQAGRQFRNILIRLISKSDELKDSFGVTFGAGGANNLINVLEVIKDRLDTGGKAAEEAKREIGSLFGVRSADAVLSLASSVDQLSEKMLDLKANAAGTAQAMSQIQIESITRQMTILKEQFTLAIQEAFGPLVNIFKAVVSHMRQFFQLFQIADKATGGLSSKIAGLVAVFTILRAIFAKLAPFLLTKGFHSLGLAIGRLAPANTVLAERMAAVREQMKLQIIDTELLSKSEETADKVTKDTTLTFGLFSTVVQKTAAAIRSLGISMGRLAKTEVSVRDATASLAVATKSFGVALKATIVSTLNVLGSLALIGAAIWALSKAYEFVKQKIDDLIVTEEEYKKIQTDRLAQTKKDIGATNAQINAINRLKTLNIKLAEAVKKGDKDAINTQKLRIVNLRSQGILAGELFTKTNEGLDKEASKLAENLGLLKAIRFEQEHTDFVKAINAASKNLDILEGQDKALKRINELKAENVRLEESTQANSDLELANTNKALKNNIEIANLEQIRDKKSLERLAAQDELIKGFRKRGDLALWLNSLTESEAKTLRDVLSSRKAGRRLLADTAKEQKKLNETLFAAAANEALSIIIDSFIKLRSIMASTQNVINSITFDNMADASKVAISAMKERGATSNEITQRIISNQQAELDARIKAIKAATEAELATHDLKLAKTLGDNEKEKASNKEVVEEEVKGVSQASAKKVLSTQQINKIKIDSAKKQIDATRSVLRARLSQEDQIVAKVKAAEKTLNNVRAEGQQLIANILREGLSASDKFDKVVGDIQSTIDNLSFSGDLGVTEQSINKAKQLLGQLSKGAVKENGAIIRSESEVRDTRLRLAKEIVAANEELASTRLKDARSEQSANEAAISSLQGQLSKLTQEAEKSFGAIATVAKNITTSIQKAIANFKKMKEEGADLEQAQIQLVGKLDSIWGDFGDTIKSIVEQMEKLGKVKVALPGGESGKTAHAGGLIPGLGEVPALLQGNEFILPSHATSFYGETQLNKLKSLTLPKNLLESRSSQGTGEPIIIQVTPDVLRNTKDMSEDEIRRLTKRIAQSLEKDMRRTYMGRAAS